MYLYTDYDFYDDEDENSQGTFLPVYLVDKNNRNFDEDLNHLYKLNSLREKAGIKVDNVSQLNTYFLKAKKSLIPGSRNTINSLIHKKLRIY